MPNTTSGVGGSWQTGDIITAERLNAMTPLIVNESDGFTFNQLAEAMENGRVVILYSSYKDGDIVTHAYNSILFDINYDSSMNRYNANFGAVIDDSGSALAALTTYRQSDPDGIMYIPD